jgi:hypothetical protein
MGTYILMSLVWIGVVIWCWRYFCRHFDWVGTMIFTAACGVVSGVYAAFLGLVFSLAIGSIVSTVTLPHSVTERERVPLQSDARGWPAYCLTVSPEGSWDYRSSSAVEWQTIDPGADRRIVVEPGRRDCLIERTYHDQAYFAPGWEKARWFTKPLPHDGNTKYTVHIPAPSAEKYEN